ncbi:MAG: glycosyltransferase [Chloroflexi bacterium]|nr:glycosyltransferase [Chloroflexota bacterium]
MIVLECNKYFHVRGGADRAFFQTMELLRARGHTVVPFSTAHERNGPSPYAAYFVDAPEWDDLKQAAPGVRLRALRDVLFNAQAYQNLQRLIRDCRPDVLHVHNLHHQLSPSILYAARAAGVPVVMTVHDYRLICANGYLYHDGLCERCVPNRFHHPILQRCIRGSRQAGVLGALANAYHWASGVWRRTVDLFLSPSRFLRARLVAAGIPADRIAVLPNGVAAADRPAPPRIGGEVLYAGAITRQKGVPTLLRAAAATPDLRFVLYGEGSERPALEDWCRRHSVTNVAFAGFVETVRLRRALHESGWVVVPSEWYENCPFAILESFAEGRAVVATALGGIPELVDDGAEGLLVPPGDPAGLAAALRTLAARPEMAVEMGVRGWRRVRAQHDPADHARTLERVLERVVGGRPATAVDPVGTPA